MYGVVICSVLLYCIVHNHYPANPFAQLLPAMPYTVITPIAEIACYPTENPTIANMTISMGILE